MGIQQIVNRIEEKGIKLRITERGDLNVKAPFKLTEQQTDFLRENKRDIVNYLTCRKLAANDKSIANIECPDNGFKQALIYEHYCYVNGFSVDWRDFEDDITKMSIVTKVHNWHSVLERQCAECSQKTTDVISECLSFDGLAEMAFSSNLCVMFSWDKCPFYKEN